MDIDLIPEPLSADAFSPFGEVIESAGRPGFPINHGQVVRHNDLAHVDTLSASGRTGISIFAARPYVLPMAIREMERHPLGSQAFIPLHPRPFLLVVAPAGDAPTASKLRAFVTNGSQGVNYARGVWHHMLLVTDEPASFAVVDRIGAGHNCDVVHLAESVTLHPAT